MIGFLEKIISMQQSVLNKNTTRTYFDVPYKISSTFSAYERVQSTAKVPR